MKMIDEFGLIKSHLVYTGLSSCSLNSSYANLLRCVALLDVREAHIANRKNPPPGWKGSVINMFFVFGEGTMFIGLLLTQIYNSGIPMAAAAGNAGGWWKKAQKANTLPCVYYFAQSNFKLQYLTCL